MHHLRRTLLVRTTRWRRMSLYWVGAIIVGLTAVLFARLGDQCADLRTRLVIWHPWALLVLAPSGFAFITWMTQTCFKGAQGSGIPQTIATLHMGNYDVIDRILTLKISAGKIILTCFGLICGASIGREGPSVQIGATIMHVFSRLLGQSNIVSKRSMILAGGAAGMAAAFNTPLAGGSFAVLVIKASAGLPGSVGRLAKRRPIMFSALCGLLTALIGLVSKGSTYGTGYAQAKAIFAGTDHYPASFFILKYLSMLISYCSGIPGGMFAPSLAIGAGIGGWIEQFLPHTTPGAVVLLGTVAYFCGVAQSPLTATIIVMEICDDQQVTLALLATAFLAFGVSRIICPKPLYIVLADRFLQTMDKPVVLSKSAPKKRDSASRENLLS
ncbi:MAG: chloride channel protein [Acetobacter sp.]|nr:chloride channel protein [Acetobacter sp.]MCH4091169.1 chloride channel protein [Acetobacter sp.]